MVHWDKKKKKKEKKEKKEWQLGGLKEEQG